VTPIIWLASYPKSGNTWFRLLLANLNSGAEGPADINDLHQKSGIASGRWPFDAHLLIESGLLTHEETDNLRPRLYELLSSVEGGAQDDVEPVGGARFMKVHDAYLPTGNGEALLGGANGAKKAIVIVRDPRDIAPSLAGHMRSDLEAAIDFMADAASAFCGGRAAQDNQLRQRLSDWSGHVASWLDQADVPTHLIRYEDLQSDTAAVLADALAFIGQSASPAEIQRAVEWSAFSELSRQEKERGFREAPRPHAPTPFFRRGETGTWREALSPEQVSRVERQHAAMMRRLGYDLVSHGEVVSSA
jgi:hypothetical protein